MREDVHPIAVHGDRRLDQARIQTRDSVFEWRAVVITRDSISGIPSNQSARCDSCRRALPTSAVQSLQVGYTTAGDGRDDGTDFLLWSLIILGALFSP